MSILKSILLFILKFLGMLLFVLCYPIFALYMRISIFRENKERRNQQAERRRKIKADARERKSLYGKRKSTFRSLFEALFTQSI